MKTVLVSLVIALLSGMGVGSGGLLVIYLSLAENVPQLTAQGINLLFFLFASSASLLVHILKRKIYIGAIAVMSLFGIFGSVFGSLVATNLPSDLLRKLFGGMLVISGILSFRKSTTPPSPKNREH